MKKILLLILLPFLYQFSPAQDKEFEPAIAVKWAPTGLFWGSGSVQGEYSFTKKNSLTAKIGVPIGKNYHSMFHGKEIDLNMKAFSFLAGYRMYFSKQKKKLRGLYLEPFFQYVHHTTSGLGQTNLNSQPVNLNFTNTYNAFGIGAQLGIQYIVAKRFVVDFFFLGPELNSATNSFRAIDPSDSGSWDNIEASQAESDIHDFLNQFPFIRNKVDVKVDKINKTVNADFNGWLTGVRFGVSFGFTF
ncbi:MAG: hypothetical protein ABUT20_18630 [Bacteroidota bacterium]